MKRRIVLATDSADPSGMGEHMLTLGAALGGEYDVVLALGEIQGSNLLRRAAEQGLRIKIINPSRPDHFRNWLRDHRADLVHIHAGIGWEGHALVRAARAAGMPVVRTEHLPYLLTSPVQQAEYRALLLSVDRRIAVSDAVARSHVGQGRGPIQVIRNGIAPQPALRTATQIRAELNIDQDEQIVLSVARFTPQKGYDLLVAAAEQVLATRPRTQFLLVGNGPEQASIQALIDDRQLGDKVRMLGARSDVPDLLAASDLFVLPSHFEGLSLALLEAMAASVPVVATAIGSTVEALGADYQHLVPPNDPAALSAAIVAALADQTASGAAAASAARRFADHFTAQRMASQTAIVYHSLLANDQGTRA